MIQPGLLLFAFLILAVLLSMLLLLALSVTFFIGAPWTPTERHVARRMLEMAGASPATMVYDVGSGDGRIVIMAAREFGASGVGIEINPILVLWSTLSALVQGVRKRTRFVLGNFFNVKLGDADVVTLFLLQPTNVRLQDKLRRELKHGTKVVSYRFTLPGWKLKGRDAKNKIYLYER